PNQSYLEGLRNHDPNVLEALFSATREATLAGVHAMGGSQPDGELMLQVGIMEMANTVRQADLPADVAFLSQLKVLALAHYADWRVERGLAPEAGSSGFSEGDWGIPTSEQLRATRRSFVAWSKYARLSPECQSTLRTELGWEYYQGPGAESTTPNSEAFANCLARYREILGSAASEGALQNGLPTWAITAVMDEKGFDLWQKTQTAAKVAATQQVEIRQRKQNRRNWAVVATLVGLILIAYLYSWSTRPQVVKVYKHNFDPPESMIADMKARYSQLAADDSTTVHTVDCEKDFETADSYYQQQQYGQAAEALEGLLEDEQWPCRSDALFYLGIIGLKLDEPDYTLASLAKIEDLEHFGEDIYWYQAMAFVKMAEKNPEQKDRAARALERAMGNLQDTARREQAQRMLEKLQH
ncbi:MAG: hypothetical protein ABIO24_09220, partial [Saprospiraceae bacterium]